MKTMEIAALATSVLPQHHEVYAREIWGPASGGRMMTVLHNEMRAAGGAEMHAHSESEHVFVVLAGELCVTNGKESCTVHAGEALVIEPGEPHQVTGNGRVDCTYLAITCPPATFA